MRHTTPIRTAPTRPTMFSAPDYFHHPDQLSCVYGSPSGWRRWYRSEWVLCVGVVQALRTTTLWRGTKLTW